MDVKNDLISKSEATQGIEKHAKYFWDNKDMRSIISKLNNIEPADPANKDLISRVEAVKIFTFDNNIDVRSRYWSTKILNDLPSKGKSHEKEWQPTKNIKPWSPADRVKPVASKDVNPER